MFRAFCQLILIVAVSTTLGCHGRFDSRDLCHGITCSGHGTCLHDDEVAWCACAPGYYDDGLECLPNGADGDADGDVDGDADIDADIDTEEELDGDLDADVTSDGDAVDADIDEIVDADPDGCDPPSCGAPEVELRCEGHWCTVPAGCFTMGSDPGELGRDVAEGLSERQHDVELTRSFIIAAHEVTQTEFSALMDYNPSAFTGCGENCPVENVNWHEAAAFCNELSEAEGLDFCYSCTGSGVDVECTAAGTYRSPYGCPGYRLPTEAEWEMAARAGTMTATYNGDLDTTGCTPSTVLDAIATYQSNCTVSYSGAHDCDEDHPCGCTSCGVAQIGSHAQNGLGLYDVLGNVWEWCHDRYEEDLGCLSVTDPYRHPSGNYRPLRGGSFIDSPEYLRAAYRDGVWATARLHSVGFRPVRTLDLEE